MPREYCRHPSGAAPLDPDKLRVIWLEEGNGAALVEGDEILAIIPPWSGEEGFHGYARDCSSESPFAWPLDEDNALFERIHRAEEYWALWDDEKFWQRFSSQLIRPLETALGPHAKYYAIDGGRWPPRALLRFDLPDRYLLITVGISLLPQPNVERYAEDPSPLRRIELAAAVEKSCPVEEVKRLGSYLSGQAQFPWSHWSWLGAGHTLDCRATPKSCGGNRFPAALLTTRLANAPKIPWPSFRGDPINLLWIVPITTAERDWAMANGSDSLIDQLIAAKVDVTIRQRRELKLS
jgi:hypothetical protein